MSPPRVLLVDDDPALLAGLRRAFRHESFTVHLACDATAGRVMLRRFPIDVLICDHELPGLAGVDFLVEVRRAYPDVISMLLTGHADIQVAATALNAGDVFRVFTKPCHPRQIALAIGTALQQQHVIRQARDALRVTAAGADAGRLSHLPDVGPYLYEVLDADTDLAALVRAIERSVDPVHSPRRSSRPREE